MMQETIVFNGTEDQLEDIIIEELDGVVGDRRDAYMIAQRVSYALKQNQINLEKQEEASHDK